MTKHSLLELQTNKIAQVDCQYEEDNSTIRELQLSIAKTEQSNSIENQHYIFPEETDTSPQLTKSITLHAIQQEQKSALNKKGDLSSQKVNLTQQQPKELTLQQVSQYFSNSSQLLEKQEETKTQHDLAKTVNDKIEKYILEGKIQLSKPKKHLCLKQEFVSNVEETALRSQLQNKKYEIIQELKRIEDEDLKFRKKKRSMSFQDKPYQKIELTKEDKAKLKELLRAKQEFDKSLTRKNEQLLQEAKKRRQSQSEQLLHQYKSVNLKKQENIKAKLKQIQQRCSQRQEALKHSTLRRNHSYAYKINQLKQKRSTSLQEEQFKQKLKQIKQRHALNIKQINQHDKKYSLQLEMRASLTQAAPLNYSLPKREKSTFAKNIEFEQNELKKKNREKVQKLLEKQFREKILLYQEKVDQYYKPKVNPSLSTVRPIPKTSSLVSLTKAEMIQKGLQYLAKAKEMKKDKKEQTIKDESKEKVSKIQVKQQKVYKNYLRGEALYNPLKKEFQSILADSDGMHKYQSALRAKHLSEGLMTQSKKTGDKQIYDAFKAKLSLLEKIY